MFVDSIFIKDVEFLEYILKYSWISHGWRRNLFGKGWLFSKCSVIPLLYGIIKHLSSVVWYLKKKPIYFFNLRKCSRGSLYKSISFTHVTYCIWCLLSLNSIFLGIFLKFSLTWKSLITTLSHVLALGIITISFIIGLIFE